MPRTLEEARPADVVPPLNQFEYFNPMELNGHRLFMAAVTQIDGRQSQVHLVYCRHCGAYFWKRALALLEQCGARSGKIGLTDQLKRIRDGLFPSPGPLYADLRVTGHTRLNGTWLLGSKRSSRRWQISPSSARRRQPDA